MSNYSNSATVSPNVTASTQLQRCWRGGHTPLSKADHFYLQVMGIDPHDLDFRMTNDQCDLLVPLFNGDSRNLVDLMLISKDGQCAHLIGKSACYSRIFGRADGRIFCTDYASAFTLWRATGRTIIVCWAPDRLKSVIDTLVPQPNDCVAVDANGPDPTASEFSGLNRFHKSAMHFAMDAGLPFFLSKPGSSFHGVGIEGTREIFSRPSISSAPVFHEHQLEHIELSGGQREDWLKQLSEAKDPRYSASLARSIALRLFPRVPVQMSLHGLRQTIETAIVTPTVHPLTMDRIIGSLTRKLDRRREDSLAPVSLSSIATSAHRHEVYASGLPTISDDGWHGVIIIFGPKGIGKTQFIGRPFARHSKKSNSRFLAICHRVSLTTELSHRLEVDCYTDHSQYDRNNSRGLAVCLPSITKPEFKTIVDAAAMVFIDEVSQVLQFLESDQYCCTANASHHQVYERLRALVRAASCVVVADANVDDRTIKFLESCRPGERFRIIDVPDPDDASIVAEYHYGENSENYIAGHGLAELASGGRVWIAAEAKTSTERLEKIFVNAGYRTLAIYADNKHNCAQRKFLGNAEAESLNYDVVIASPVIGSGISIEHKNTPEEAKFTLGLYVGGGFTTTPAEATQQICRVRYINRYVIGIRPNKSHHGKNLSTEQLLTAATTASNLEGTLANLTSFDQFVAEIRTKNVQARSDFAAGLIWQLDSAGWTLHQNRSDQTPVNTNNVALEIEARHETALIQAPVIGDNEARALKSKRDRTETQNLILEAHNLRTELGVGADTLTPELIRLWDRGRGINRIDFFNYFRGIVPQYPTSARSVICRDYPIATATLLQWIFSDIDLIKGVDKNSARAVIERVWMKNVLCDFLGISTSMPRKRRDGIKEINAILGRMNLKIRGKTERKPNCSPEPRESCTKGNPQTRVYRLCRDSYEELTEVADRRNQYRRTQRLNRFPPIG